MTDKTKEKIGALRFKGNPEIEVHTKTALMLWNGREKSENEAFIISVPSYLKRLYNMEDAIKQDDPYADRTYYEIQEAIEEAKELYNAKKQEIQDILGSLHSRVCFPATGIDEPRKMKILTSTQHNCREEDQGQDSQLCIICHRW